jgi:hypothetical protein
MMLERPDAASVPWKVPFTVVAVSSVIVTKASSVEV